MDHDATVVTESASHIGTPPPASVWSHLDMAARQRADGDLEAAIESCRHALALDEECADAWRLLGFVAQDRNDLYAAVEALRTARRLGASDHWTHYALGDSLRQLGQYDDAVSSYECALAAKADFPEAHRQIGVIERTRGREPLAREYFERALQLSETAAQAASGRALFAPCDILPLLGRPDEAEDRLANLDDPDSHPELRFEIQAIGARIAEIRGDIEQEIIRRREMAHLRPQLGWVWQALVGRLLAARRHGAALEVIETALGHLPDNPALLTERARMLRLTGKAREGLDQLLAVPGHGLASAGDLLVLANEFRAAAMFDRAGMAAEAAIGAAPRNIWAHLVHASTILEQMGPTAGLARFRRVLQDFPGEPEVIRQVSRVLRDCGDALAARDVLLQGSVGPASPTDLLEELVICLCQCGEFERARVLIRSIGAISPDSALVLELEIELSAGDINALGPLVARARQLELQNPSLLSRIIRAAHAVNDFEAVIRASIDWMAIDPPHALYCQIAIAEAEFRLGRLDPALETLSGARQAHGIDPDLYLARGRILRQSGGIVAAAECLTEGVNHFPGHTALWAEHVRLFIQTNRMEHARHALASVNEQDFDRIGTRDLLEIEFALERRDIDDAIARVDRFRPHSAHQRALYDNLAFRAHLAALDLPAARICLASEFSAARADRKLRRQSSNMSQSLMGQLVDDFRLDSETVRALLTIRAMPPGERSTLLLQQVRMTPDSTAAAITTLLHLRQTGFFLSPHADDQSVIPPRIAQFWHDDHVPDDVAAYMQTWRSRNEGWTYECFSEGRAAAFIRRNCSDRVATAYALARDATAQSDLFRLAWLAHQGGIYVDADDVATGPVAEMLGSATRLAVHQEDTGSIGNNFIAAVPGHPVISAALAEATASILRGDSDMVWLSTGPGLLSRCFTRWLASQEDLETLRLETVVLDRADFTRICACHCHAAYKLTASHWARDLFG